METPSTFSAPRVELQQLEETVNKIKTEVQKVVIGQDTMIDLILTSILTGGHILLEGVPGIAKTLTAKLIARSLSVGFSRVQFTPDLMPTDLTGTNVYNLKTSEFSFNRGPIFSNLVLIDEINRAPAKTQAALFEVMEEKQITVDGKTYKMEFPFIVLATQNPVEQEGTYRLPEAQLDRFLFRIKINYPTLENEKDILKRFKEDFNMETAAQVQAVVGRDELQRCQDIIKSIYIKDELLDYIAQIVHQTRNSGDLFLGASPRASLAIMKASKAYAGINGRDFVTPDDIQTVAYPVLNHRIILTPEREMENMRAEDVIKQIINGIEVPR
ncbi:MAG: MoxR family ATPase [Chitinophagales bacterium]